MAKIEKLIGKETKMVPKEVEVLNGVTISMSIEEAIALYLLAGSVGGTPEGSIRPYTDQFYRIIGDVLDMRGFERKEFVRATVNTSPEYGHQDYAKDGDKAEEFIQYNVKRIARLTN